MAFRPPHMTYVPRKLEGWERVIAFTVLARPFDAVYPQIAGVVRQREGPLSETRGERRPPLMVQAALPDQVINGVLVYAPKEAAGLTVIEHPLDEVAPEDFPASLTRVLPQIELVTFWSNLETTIRQEHGYKVTRGGEVLRRVDLTRGNESGHWQREAEGAVQPFENRARLAETRIWRRLDRALIFDYAARLGLDPARSLFGRAFGASRLLTPLPPHKPDAVAEMTTAHTDMARAARQAGVRKAAPDFGDAGFAGAARAYATMERLDIEFSHLARKAWESSQRCKTPEGRERAQWRTLEELARWNADWKALGGERSVSWYVTMRLDDTMKALGRETEAFRAYRRQFPPWWAVWR